MTSSSSKRTHAVYISSDDESTTQPVSARPSAKRARAEPDPALWNLITSLPPSKKDHILLTLCQKDPALADHVRHTHQQHLAEEAANEAARKAAEPPVNFDQYSRTCWHALNTEHKRKKSSAQYNAAGDVSHDIDNARRAIMKKAGKGTRWETRRNALEVLRKISKSVMLCEVQVIRRELMKDGILLGGFADSMLRLAKGMSEFERQRYKGEGLWEKLWELQGECEDIDINMRDLFKVYSVFDGAPVSQDEEEDEMENESDEEEEEEGESDIEDIDSDGLPFGCYH